MNFLENNAYPTQLRNSPLLPILLLSLAQQTNAPKTTDTFKDEYDYIVVGGGSAGAVVASRLSEYTCVSVLLLEAGKSPPLLNDVPGIARNFWFTDLDWQYKTVPQKHSGDGLINKQVLWPSGKGLGGSSLLNGMLYVRGNHKNYDDWAKQGATGWNYSEVLPYFKKLEDNKDYNNEYHGVGGPVTVHKPRYAAEVRESLLETSKLLGYEIHDSNGATQTGYYDHQANHRNGQRCSTAKAYLVPAEDRENLNIVTHAFVKKIVIKDHQAVGVEFDHGGASHTVRAKREVIMSAGTVNTAQLLMLSGIGPKEHLQKMNIEVIEDLPVGDNFQDHPSIPTPIALDSSVKTIIQKSPRGFFTYLHDRTGPLASTEGIGLITFLNGEGLRPKEDIPDFQNYYAEVPYEYLKQFGLKPEVLEGTFGPYKDTTMAVFIAQIVHPKSRGTVRLNSTDPHDPPLIDPNYYEDPQDLKDMVEAIKTGIKIATSEPMQKFGARRFDNVVPGCENLSGDKYIECIAKSMPLTTSHPVGTAKMGNPNDPTTVVDPELRVKNVKGLRVVDASVMPLIPYGNTNVPTIMVAEKGSDIIKKSIECDKKVPLVSRDDPNSPKYEKPGGFISIAAGVFLTVLNVIEFPIPSALVDAFERLVSRVAQG